MGAPNNNKRNKQKKKYSPEYQYNKPQYHPVEEYVITTAEKLTSDTPSFVLEVTWPRVAIFYHPASPLCLELRDRYVAVAREIRRRSIRVPVEFWAVSCQVHRDACEDLGVEAVPRLLAFPAGKIEGELVQRTKSNGIQVEDIIEILGINLKDTAREEGDTMQDKLQLQQIQNKAKEMDSPYQMHHLVRNQQQDHIKEILHPHSALSDVYSDAMTSLLHSIDKTVERDNKHRVIPWSRDKFRAFRLWLDLMHWSLPTRDMAQLHNMINDLRNNAIAIGKNPREIVSILASHGYYKSKPKWSDSCIHPDQNDEGYTCGFWKLLHIVSVGVVEQHHAVMGDLDRILIPHVLETIKGYIEYFGFAQNNICQELLLQEYDDCLQDLDCQRDIGMEKHKGILRRIFSGNNIPHRSHKSWLELSIWLWKVHQKYRTDRLSRLNHRGGGAGAGGNGGEEVQWPPAVLCNKCYSTRSMPGMHTGRNKENNNQQGEDENEDEDEEEEEQVDDNLIVDEDNQIMWNKRPVFNHLKQEYWPRALQTPRVVVLDKWDKGKTGKSFGSKRMFVSGISSLISFDGVSNVSTILFFLGLWFCWLWISKNGGRVVKYKDDDENVGYRFGVDNDDSRSIFSGYTSFISLSKYSKRRAFRPQRRHHGRGSRSSGGIAYANRAAGFRSGGPQPYFDA